MSNDLIILDGIIQQIKDEVAPEMKADDYFELLVAEQITKDYDLSYEQIEDGNPGGAGDGGIDSFHIFVNGLLIEEDTAFPDIKNDINIRLIISQTKNKTGYEEEVINKLVAFSEDVFDLANELDKFIGVYNQDLLEIVERFRNLYLHYARSNPNLQISFYYGTRAKAEPNANILRKADLLKDKIKGFFSNGICDFTFIGASELLQLLRLRPKSVFELRLAENPVYPSNGGNSLVGLVKLHDFFDFIADDSHKLVQHIFEANVRDYQGHNTVNKQILETLRGNHEDDFWWLNNGITILSTSVDSRVNRVLNIENPEIVNGLQTSRGIYTYFAGLIEAGQTELHDDRNLLVRIIVPNEEKSRDKIILATNSQTQIPIEALKSTEKIHRDIEAYLLKSGIYYDRRKNYWKLQGKPASQILTIKKLAQAVQSIALYNPRIAKASPSGIFRKGNEDGYSEVFSSDYPIDLYNFCAALIIRVEDLLRSDNLKTDLNQRAIGQIKFHTLTHIVIRETGIPKPVPTEIIKLSIKSITDELILDSAQRILDIFVDMGPNNITSKSTDFANTVLDDAKSLI